MHSTFLSKQLQFLLCAYVVLVAIWPAPAQAQSPGLTVAGVEFCPQFLCPDGAVFVYKLHNDGKAVGSGFAQIDHDAVLPAGEGSCVPILGGQFAFSLGWQFVSGEVVGGEVCAMTNPDLFQVTILMLTENDVPLCFEGVLDHRPLRRRPPRLPTIGGQLFLCAE